MLDNFARGRCRHVWFSISADLRLDAQRFANIVTLNSPSLDMLYWSEVQWGIVKVPVILCLFKEN